MCLFCVGLGFPAGLSSFLPAQLPLIVPWLVDSLSAFANTLYVVLLDLLRQPWEADSPTAPTSADFSRFCVHFSKICFSNNINSICVLTSVS